MDCFYRFIVAGISQGVFDDGLEGFFLVSSWQRERAAQELLDKGIVQVIAVFGVVKGAVQVGGAVVEGWE